MSISRWIGLVGLLVVVFLAAGCSPAASEPVVVTVINTVPVEVTRLVEVQRTVEVVREVVVTEIVEVQVPVTVTAVLEEGATPTPQASPVPSEGAGAGSAVVYASPTIDLNAFKDQKVQGFAPLKVINETGSTLTVVVNGPTYLSMVLGGHSSTIEIVAEAEYSYAVWEENEIIYSGTMRFTNPDKHELVIHNNRVVFKVP